MTTLDTLTDRAALTDLVTRLGRWLDTGAAADADDLLHADVVARTPGGRSAGRDAVVAQARRTHDVPTQHVITGHLVSVDEDAATVEADLHATFVRPAGIETVGERYAFAARRTADGWRLTSIETRLLWRG